MSLIKIHLAKKTILATSNALEKTHNTELPDYYAHMTFMPFCNCCRL
jgi:hypothetical protein